MSDLTFTTLVPATTTSEPAPVVRKPTKFAPNERQKALKLIAISASEEGRGFLRDWIKDSRHLEIKGGEFSNAEWKKWLKLDGFRQWFYDFPLPRTVSDEDIEGMDHVFWDSVRQNLRDGDGRTMELYAKITGKVGKKDDDDRGNSAVITWLQDGAAGAAAWMGSPKQLTEKG
jgi:hypothetical protein